MTDEPTPNQETLQTPGAEAETKEETYTKSQLTDLIKGEVGKVVKKHAKEKEAWQKELDDLKKANLPDPEKTKLEMDSVTKERDDYKSKFEGLNLKILKREALEAAKLTLPEDVTLTDLLELMPGSEEDIPTHLERFKKMFPASKGLGTATTTGAPNAQKLTLKEQANAIEKQLQDPKLDWMTQRKLNDELGTINAKLLLGVTS